MFYFARLFCVFYIMFSDSQATKELRPVTVYLGSGLRKLRVFDKNIYIGGTDRIYVLNEDLSMKQNASTCGIGQTSCGNINQILLLHENRKELLVCGTVNNGICDVRSLKNIEHAIRNSSGITSPMKVSTDINRPAQALITTNGHVTIAVTFGKGIDKIQPPERKYTTFDYAISSRNFTDFKPVNSNKGTKVLNLEIESSRFNDYVIYYKAGFQLNWYTYFVTNQNNYVGGSKYVSKLVKICQNDSDFNSYTDIVIQCKHNGTVYNLIQDVKVLDTKSSTTYADTGGLFIGVFGRGDDPKNPRSDSIICLSKLKDLDEEILFAKKKHALTCERNYQTRRYLPNLKSTSSCLTETDLQFRDFNSCENSRPIFLYIIGNSSFSMKSSHKVTAEDGFVTALHGAFTSDGNIEIIVGTSAGYILQMTLFDYGMPLTPFRKLKVKPPVRSVYIKDDDTIYAMNDEEVVLINRYNCSEYSSCNDAMAERDPLCGWCVYKQRVTRKADCSDEPNHWISSLRDCNLKMSVVPHCVPVSNSRNAKVTVKVTVRNLPEPVSEDLYMCNLLIGTVTVGATQAERNGSTFTCILPRVHDHTEAVLQLLVRPASLHDVVLAEAQVLFFQCEHFNRCGECVSESRQCCEWCTEETRCQVKGTPCFAELKTSKEFCPRLQDTRGRNFVHTGVLTSVKFYANHLPKNPSAHLFSCKVSPVSYQSRAFLAGDSIHCNLNISRTLDLPKQDYRVNISYVAKGQHASELDDDFGNFVTVYNCPLLANDCSRCRALNKSRYRCDWCSNKNECGYRDENCTVFTCPAPTITKVIPRDGPTIGYTRITVMGYNLGSEIADIEKVEIANISCELSKDTRDFCVTKNVDFESQAPTQIVCYTRPSVGEKTGFVHVTIDGMKSTSLVEYSYRVLVVTDIHPKHGPKAGGTRLTIFGRNLGIGNRNISVLFGNKHCLKPMVKPDLPLDQVFSGNFTIVCIVDGDYSANVTTLNMTIDGKEVTNKASFLYTFISNPEVQTPIAKKAFLSGGTKIFIEGRYLNSANEAQIRLSYKGEDEVEKCEIESSNLVTCKVPRAPKGLWDTLLEANESLDCLGCILVTLVLNLDNIKADIEVKYYQDPVIDNIAGDSNIVTLKSDSRLLIVTGSRLNCVATISDIKITVGTESCVLAELQTSYMSCIAPISQPKPGIPHAEYPEVNVTVGNIRKTVGYLKYLDNLDSTVAIVSSAVTAVVFILSISLCVFLMYWKSRKLQDLIKQNSIYRQPAQTGSSYSCNQRAETSSICSNASGLTGIYNRINGEEIYEPDMSSLHRDRINEVELYEGYMSPLQRNRVHVKETCERDMPSLHRDRIYVEKPYERDISSLQRNRINAEERTEIFMSDPQLNTINAENQDELVMPSFQRNSVHPVKRHTNMSCPQLNRTIPENLDDVNSSCTLPKRRVVRIQSKLTFQVEVVEETGDLVLLPNAMENDTYLHPVHCNPTKDEVKEEFQSEDEITLDNC